MSFDKYAILNEETAVLYLREKISFFDAASRLSCTEIGDGNLNFVYRIMDEVSKKSIIIKQAADFARATPEYKLSADRGRIEAEILMYQNKLAKGFVPEVYLYDSVMCCCIMEDLREYKILRRELIEFNAYPQFAKQMAEFLADTLIKTSDVIMDSSEKKQNVKRFINPELCKISEDLVFTDALTNYGKTNDVFAQNADYVKQAVYENTALLLEGAKLSVKFKNFAQSLLHGDLHSGSIFIKENSVKIFDPEFSFYGPAGYDVGNVIGNLIFAWAAAAVEKDTSLKAEAFLQWLVQAVTDIIDIFACRGVELITSSASDALYRTEAFANWYINSILKDAAGYAGLEIIRRVIGEAHVKDITRMPDKLRIQAERLLLDLGSRMVINREAFTSGKAFADILSFED